MNLRNLKSFLFFDLFATGVILVLRLMVSVSSYLALISLVPLLAILSGEDMPPSVSQYFFLSNTSITIEAAFIIGLSIYGLAGLLQFLGHLGAFNFYRVYIARIRLTVFNSYLAMDSTIEGMPELGTCVNDLIISPERLTKGLQGAGDVIESLLTLAMIGVSVVFIFGIDVLVFVALGIPFLLGIVFDRKLMKLAEKTKRFYELSTESVGNFSASYRTFRISGNQNWVVERLDDCLDKLNYFSLRHFLLNSAYKILREFFGIFILLGICAFLIFIQNYNILEVGVMLLFGRQILHKVTQIQTGVTECNKNYPFLRSILKVQSFKRAENRFLELSPNDLDNNVLIRFNSVTAKRKDGRVVGPLTMRLEQKQIVAIDGPSGVGKSTLVETMIGFSEIVDGSIAMSPRFRFENTAGRAFGYVGQDASIIEGTLRDNIVMGREYCEHFFSEVLSLCGLDDFVEEDDSERVLKSLGASVSGGQQKRIAFARAVYGKPMLLLLDEFSVGLDAKTESIVLATCQKLASEGCCIVLISHSKSVKAIADQVIKVESSVV